MENKKAKETKLFNTLAVNRKLIFDLNTKYQKTYPLSFTFEDDFDIFSELVCNLIARDLIDQKIFKDGDYNFISKELFRRNGGLDLPKSPLETTLNSIEAYFKEDKYTKSNK